jgi:chromosome segregation ATPase
MHSDATVPEYLHPRETFVAPGITPSHATSVSSASASTRAGRRSRSQQVSKTAAAPDDGNYEVCGKRQRHLESNRQAAKKCRQKTKDQERHLEARGQELMEQNSHLNAEATALKDEVISLKNEILMHATCDDDLITDYITHAATEL